MQMNRERGMEKRGKGMREKVEKGGTEKPLKGIRK